MPNDKISAGAKRAAEAMFPHSVKAPLSLAESIYRVREAAAAIIERETRAGELADALEKLLIAETGDSLVALIQASDSARSLLAEVRR